MIIIMIVIIIIIMIIVIVLYCIVLYWLVWHKQKCTKLDKRCMYTKEDKST